MGPKKFSSFPLNEKFSGLSVLSGIVPNYASGKGSLLKLVGHVVQDFFCPHLTDREER